MSNGTNIFNNQTKSDQNHQITKQSTASFTVKKNLQHARTRRSLLAMTGVTGALVWHKPLIKTVILPSHAQTSSVPVLPAAVMLTFPGTTLTCTGTIQPAVFNTVFVDDSGVTPVIALSSPSASATSITHGISESAIAGGTRIVEFVSTPGLTVIQRAQLNCITGVVLPLVGGALPATISTQIVAASGALWDAVGTVTSTTTSMTISDIILTPV